MLSKVTTPSGAELEIEQASFEQCCDLYDAVCEIVIGLNISVEYVFRSFVSLFVEKSKENPELSISDLQISDIISADGAVDAMSRVFLAVSSSKKCRTIFFKCLGNSRYNNEVIRPDLFNRSETRQDYLPILKECMKLNLLPFTPSRSFASKEVRDKIISTF